MVDVDIDDVPVNLLALDGGGIRGVSELLILDEIMRRLQFDLKLKELPLPCDYFHLIGGTSTGGLIAIMLGRLRMSTQEALAQYSTLAGRIFSKENKQSRTKDGAFKASALEAEVKKIVSARGISSTRMLDPDVEGTVGKSFVCAMPALNMSHPRLFRSYLVRTNASANCEIWEAARATTAAPTFFERIYISDAGQAAEEYIDGGIRCNNPIQEVLDEAKNVFGDKRRIGCIVSIGTGDPGVIGLAKPGSLQNLLPTQLIDVLTKIATDCKLTADRVAKRFVGRKGVYFRLNVTHGAGQIALDEWEKMGEVSTHTKSYVEDSPVTTAIDEVVNSLCMRHASVTDTAGVRPTIADICGIGIKTVEHPQYKKKPRSSPRFIGRKHILHQMKMFFTAKSEEDDQERIFALTGIGGAGKTQVCLKFAESSSTRSDCFTNVFWIDASSDATITQSFKAIGDLQGVKSLGPCDTPDSILQSLSKLGGRWLFIIDNADQGPEAIERYLPYGPGANTIITSRHIHTPSLASPGGHAEVKELEEDEAVALLLRSAHPEHSSPEDKDIARTIVSALHCLALAVDQAGAYIGQGYCNLHQYLDIFSQNRKGLLNHPSLKGASSYDCAVYASWDLSHQAIELTASRKTPLQTVTAAKNALEILQLFAFFHYENISEEIFQRAATTVDDRRMSCHPDDPQNHMKRTYGYLPRHLLQLDKSLKWNSDQFRQGVQVLISLSLVKAGMSGTSYDIHPLVHAWSRERMAETSFDPCARSTCAILSHSVRSQDDQENDRRFKQDLIPHLNAWCQHTGFGLATRNCGDEECLEFGFALADAGYSEKSEVFYKLAMEHRKSVLGPKHGDTLYSIRKLANAVMESGNPQDAEDLLQEILAPGQNSDVSDPLTLRAKQQLASCYSDQGKYAAAEALGTEVVAIMRNTPGSQDSDTISAIRELSEIYQFHLKYNESEVLLQEVLYWRVKVLGSCHPATLKCKSELSQIYCLQSKYTEAEEILLQTLELQQGILRANHPDILYTESTIAGLLKLQGRLDEAKVLCEKVLLLRRETLGEDHRRTLYSIEQLAQIELEQGNLSQARNLCSILLQKYQKILVKDHPETIRVIGILGKIAWKEGHSNEARDLLEEALRTSRKVLSEDHPDTIYSMQKLGEFYWEMEERAEAKALLEEALKKGREVCGENHVDTIWTMQKLGEFYWDMGQSAEAKVLLEEALKKRREVLGENHSDTVHSLEWVNYVNKNTDIQHQVHHPTNHDPTIQSLRPINERLKSLRSWRHL